MLGSSKDDNKSYKVILNIMHYREKQKNEESSNQTRKRKLEI